MSGGSDTDDVVASGYSAFSDPTSATPLSNDAEVDLAREHAASVAEWAGGRKVWKVMVLMLVIVVLMGVGAVIAYAAAKPPGSPEGIPSIDRLLNTSVCIPFVTTAFGLTGGLHATGTMVLTRQAWANEGGKVSRLFIWAASWLFYAGLFIGLLVYPFTGEWATNWGFLLAVVALALWMLLALHRVRKSFRESGRRVRVVVLGILFLLFSVLAFLFVVLRAAPGAADYRKPSAVFVIETLLVTTLFVFFVALAPAFRDVRYRLFTDGELRLDHLADDIEL